MDLYLKWSLVVSDPILKNENVAEQFLLIGAIDFNGWSHIDQSGTFFHQTMITIAIGDQRNARFDPELKLFNSYKAKAKLEISWLLNPLSRLFCAKIQIVLLLQRKICVVAHTKRDLLFLLWMEWDTTMNDNAQEGIRHGLAQGFIDKSVHLAQ